ncbi:MAG: isoleucine--tRNA ligase [Rickettsiales bacterium]|jgi:isoleucyl-tRNA synthetase|nr:isoleucine--tRNA ligase [Rickettsiales bacterium]
MSSKNRYPETSPKPDFPKMEEAVLAFWNKAKIFEKSIESRDKSKEFVFYDGPPFGNGLPHYGHVFQSYAKDTVGRYKTMRGYRVGRRWGWDCHGLPPEMKMEKDLGLSGKKAIEAYGVGEFVEKCREDVLRYTEEWKGVVARLGRWVDMENAYKTLDTGYSESVMWAFKTLYEKGMIYEEFRILPYSWAAETVLSNFEVNLAYKEKVDPAITVKFRLENGPYLLVWTTTPWTLPSNMMLAVGENLAYGVYRLATGEEAVVAETRAAAYKKELAGAKLVRTLKGSDLVGLCYEPPFGYFRKAGEDACAFRVLAADFVSDADGTGIVHIAPGFGEDDFALCRKFNPDFPIVCPVDGAGRFEAEVSDWAGVQVFEANHSIMENLSARGMLFKKDQIVHQYPFCWRTDKPLIYKAMSSWFVKVTDIKDSLIALNRDINWIPGHIRDGRFGKWLEGARDWSISRNRFWGAPIPVWRAEDGEQIVVGSIAELEKLSGRKIGDLHRPYIDIEFTRGGKTFKRVPDVFDCWFESGSMPFASLHYPFENKDKFQNNFPADFIGEGVDQTRGWFYTLAVLGAALFGKIPFKNCACTGFIFDEKKQKLSKKLGNYSEPTEFFNKYGSDSFRWLMLASPLLKGEVMYISKDGDEIAKSARKSLIPLYNAYHFFTLYANADGIKASYGAKSDELMDRYIMAKLAELKSAAAKHMDRYDMASFCYSAEKFLDALNNWYIRLSRERFWGTSVSKASQQKAFDTLYTVLADLCRLAAPLAPFTTEHIYKSLTGEESVHLATYPEADEEYDRPLVEAMDLAGLACSAAKAIREEAGIRNRQPLSLMTIASAKASMLGPYSGIIARESNVKKVEFTEDVGKVAKEMLYIHTPAVGKRLGSALAGIQKAAVAGEYEMRNGACIIAGQELQPHEYEIKLEVGNGMQGRATADNSAVVMLDTAITPALATEGIIRDFIRAVQEERKNAGLSVTDRIRIGYSSHTESIAEGVKAFGGEIMGATLAVALEQAAGDGMKKLPEADLRFTIEEAK